MSLQDPTVEGVVEYEKDKFEAIHGHSYALELAETVFGKQVFNLSIKLEKGKESRSLERKIMTVDRLENNPDEAAKT